MGVWGPAIFSDDTASDIRNEYRELLEDQVPDEEATQRILHRYQDLDDDEVHVLWLALAAAQQQAGRLEARVRDEALCGSSTPAKASSIGLRRLTTVMGRT